MQSMTGPSPSVTWREYFEDNAKRPCAIAWERGADLDRPSRAAVARSIQEFQRGESSEGKHLYHYAERYANDTGDYDYLYALRLLIAEEHRHARDLARFLQLNGIPLVKRTFADSVFRRLRNLFRSLEVSVAVLVIAEIFAQVYYAALQRATGSTVLRQLCERILEDEERHVQFQTWQLARMAACRPAVARHLPRLAQRFLFMGTCLVVWSGHRRALRAGGHSFASFWSAAWRQFRLAFAPSTRAPGLASRAMRMTRSPSAYSRASHEDSAHP
jgi:bacterioferritin (cytochrome b1)